MQRNTAHDFPSTRPTCAGGCGGGGFCPGTALLLSLGAAYALHHFTGWGWPVLPVVVFGTLALALGRHNYLNPFRRRG